jgi:hypothetical protein
MMRALGVAVVTESSRMLLTCARPAFSWDGGTAVRKVWSKWAVTCATGIGRCATAPRNQRAWTPTGLLGRLTAPAVADVAGEVEVDGVDDFGAAPEQAAAAAVTAAAASASAAVRAMAILDQSFHARIT